MYSRNKLLTLLSELKTERSTWDTHWTELSDFIMPRRVRFQRTDRNRNDRRNNKIINNGGTLAARTLRSGMVAGITSPARPWFKLATYNPEMSTVPSVRNWLYEVTRRMNTVMLRSNLYNGLPVLYGDLGVFGTGAMAVLEDKEKYMRCMTFPLGSYVLSVNEKGVVDTIMRDCDMTVRQIVGRFAKRNPKSGSIQWTNVSSHVRNLYERGTLEAMIPVTHTIMPNEIYDNKKIDGKYKKYVSLYFEEQCNDEIFLSESGYDDFPVMAVRWDVLGNDIYGSPCPGMEALGDIKSLQVLERRKAQAVEKLVNPPMTGPTSLRNQKATILPGDITYVDTREGQQGFRPAHEINFSVKEVILDIENHQKRISRAFYEDLFLMLTMSDRREITATEVQERHEEKLLMLGPVLERLNDELLDPLIDRVFNVMLRMDLIPEPPPELQGQELRVEYLSVMAQAQKLISAGGVERFMGFVGNVAAAQGSGEIWDKVNTDMVVTEYGDMTGLNPMFLRDEGEVKAIRENRARAAQQAAQAENMKKSSEAMKNASDAKINDDESVLSRVIGGLAEQAA